MTKKMQTVNCRHCGTLVYKINTVSGLCLPCTIKELKKENKELKERLEELKVRSRQRSLFGA